MNEDDSMTLNQVMNLEWRRHYLEMLKQRDEALNSLRFAEEKVKAAEDFGITWVSGSPVRAFCENG